MKPEDFIKELEKKLDSVEVSESVMNVGTVTSVGDGVVRATGLSRAGYGEEVAFEDGTRGLVLNLDEDSTSIVLFSRSSKIQEGSQVNTTGKILSIEVSEDLIGRVIDPLGASLDGKPLKITKGKVYPLEKIAAGVVERQPVDKIGRAHV